MKERILKDRPDFVVKEVEFVEYPQIYNLQPTDNTPLADYRDLPTIVNETEKLISDLLNMASTDERAGMFPPDLLRKELIAHLLLAADITSHHNFKIAYGKNIIIYDKKNNKPLPHLSLAVNLNLMKPSFDTVTVEQLHQLEEKAKSVTTNLSISLSVVSYDADDVLPPAGAEVNLSASPSLKHLISTDILEVVRCYLDEDPEFQDVMQELLTRQLSQVPNPPSGPIMGSVSVSVTDVTTNSPRERHYKQLLQNISRTFINTDEASLEFYPLYTFRFNTRNHPGIVFTDKTLQTIYGNPVRYATTTTTEQQSQSQSQPQQPPVLAGDVILRALNSIPINDYTEIVRLKPFILNVLEYTETFIYHYLLHHPLISPHLKPDEKLTAIINTTGRYFATYLPPSNSFHLASTTPASKVYQYRNTDLYFVYITDTTSSTTPPYGFFVEISHDNTSLLPHFNHQLVLNARRNLNSFLTLSRSSSPQSPDQTAELILMEKQMGINNQTAINLKGVSITG